MPPQEENCQHYYTHGKLQCKQEGQLALTRRASAAQCYTVALFLFLLNFSTSVPFNEFAGGAGICGQFYIFINQTPGTIGLRKLRDPTFNRSATQ